LAGVTALLAGFCRTEQREGAKASGEWRRGERERKREGRGKRTMEQELNET